MNSKRAQFLNELLKRPAAAKQIAERVDALQQAVEGAGIVSKAMHEGHDMPKDEEVMQPEEDKAAVTTGVKDIADAIMSLVASEQPDDVKRQQLEEMLAALTVEGEDMPDEAPVMEEAGYKKPEMKSAEPVEDAPTELSVKAADMFAQVLEDMETLALSQKAMDEAIPLIKSFGDTMARLSARVEAIEKQLALRPRAASAAPETAIDEASAPAVVKEARSAVDPFWGVPLPTATANNPTRG